MYTICKLAKSKREYDTFKRSPLDQSRGTVSLQTDPAEVEAEEVKAAKRRQRDLAMSEEMARPGGGGGSEGAEEETTTSRHVRGDGETTPCWGRRKGDDLPLCVEGDTKATNCLSMSRETQRQQTASPC